MPTFKLKSAEKLEGDFGPGVNCAIGNDYGYLPSGPYRRPGYATSPVGQLLIHAIEVRFTCSSCHAEFIQKFKGTHEDYEWLQHHYNKVDHVVVCEPCRNSCQWDDC